MTTKPHLAVTLGDPAGIGPEVVLKALTDFSDQSLAQLTLVGARSLWQDTYQRLQALGKPAANP
ncbi:MAG: 4-hydroxythreonine-4-phosphate dehydrogenase, partial [Microcystaceae cyanobacterium]